VFEELNQKFSDICATYYPDNFVSVSEFYNNFDQVPDVDVMDILSNY
jgi:predicted phosphoribosyltransferase